MKCEGYIRLSGKKHYVTMNNGENFIDGIPVKEFMKTITEDEKLQLIAAGKAVLEDLGKTEKRDPQKMLDEFHQSKNN